MKLLVLLFIPILSFTQEYKVPTTPMLSFLYETKGNINAITNTSKLKLIPIKIGSDKLIDYYKIIKHNTGLYFLLNGTGQIYKATNLKEGNLYISRIDSTIYLGNTFFSIDFMYEDTLFSLGGYGFWRDNGQLRKYNQKYHEWEIVKLNSRFKASMKSEYLDLTVSKLFYIQSPANDEDFDLDVKEFSVISLDLINKENKELGIINKEISKFNSFDYYIELPSLNGTLFTQNKNYYLFQYNKNLVYKLVNKKVIDAIKTPDFHLAQFTFEKDNKIYYCSYPDTTIKSIDISIKDFSLEPYSIYEPASSIKKFLDSIIYTTIISILLFFIFKLYKNKYKIIKNKVENFEEVSRNLEKDDFSNFEKELISVLIEKSNKGLNLSIDEMNFVLGLKNKPIQIQKTVRNETINRINYKFNTLFDVETSFIIRIKSENDKRSFNYSIENENMTRYLKQKKNINK